MELVKNYVKKAMPSLSSDQMDTLMAKLEELGVLSVDDLSLVDPEDIKDTLPFIQCKRFVRAVKALEAGEFLPLCFNASFLRLQRLIKKMKKKRLPSAVHGNNYPIIGFRN